MRRILLFTLLLGLVSCSDSAELIDYSNKEILEEVTIEYPNSFIEWNTLLSQMDQNYFVYVFSYDCYYCKETKRRIICFHDNSPYPLYFVEYTKEIPIGHNTLNTIGKSDLVDVFIRGTPTLMLISEGAVSINVAGKEEVNEMIDLYLKIK